MDKDNLMKFIETTQIKKKAKIKLLNKINNQYDIFLGIMLSNFDIKRKVKSLDIEGVGAGTISKIDEYFESFQILEKENISKKIDILVGRIEKEIEQKEIENINADRQIVKLETFLKHKNKYIFQLLQNDVEIINIFFDGIYKIYSNDIEVLSIITMLYNHNITLLVNLYDLIIKPKPVNKWNDEPKLNINKLDEIALNLGYDMTSPNRINAHVINATMFAMGRVNSVYVNRKDIVTATDESVNFGNKYDYVEKDHIVNAIDYMIDHEKLTKYRYKEDYYTLTKYYDMEIDIIKKLDIINSCEKETISNYQEFKRFELREENMELSDEQMQIVKSVSKNRINILTGYPGTGKTQCVLQIIKMLKENTNMIYILGPTGISVVNIKKRVDTDTDIKIKELDEYKKGPSTIHSFIYFLKKKKERQFHENNFDTSLVGDSNNYGEVHIIIDECSMITIELFHQLLYNIDQRFSLNKVTLILVGDDQQLPPIGIGQLFRYLIHSQKYPHTSLKQIRRQDEGSFIRELSKKIIESNIDKIDHKIRRFIKDDEHWKKKSYIESILFGKRDDRYDRYFYKNMKIDELVERVKGNYINPDTTMILCSTNNTKDLINDRIQTMYKNTTTKLFNKFYMNDRVMQIKNNYQLPRYGIQPIPTTKDNESGVFNGEIGTIIDTEYVDNILVNIIVDYGNKKIKYNKKECRELDLAYACTAHKSQGLEAKRVIYIIENLYHISKNLVYTAVTRAQKELFVFNHGAPYNFENILKSKDLGYSLIYHN